MYRFNAALNPTTRIKTEAFNFLRGRLHETEVNSNRFEFEVTGVSLHSVYMTSPEVKLTSPLISLRSK